MDKFIYEEIDGEIYSYPNPDYRENISNLNLDKILPYTGIPKNYLKFEMNDLLEDKNSNSRSVAMCQNYINKVSTTYASLYISGNNSTGKTTLMCTIGKQLVSKGYKLKFINFFELTNLLLKNTGYGTNEYNAKYESLFKNDILLIDKAFDKEKSIYWESKGKLQIISTLDSFFSTFLDDGKKIILTSDINISSIATDYSPNLYSLIGKYFKVVTLSHVFINKVEL